MVRVIKKKTTRFNRHFSDRYDRVGASWRRPKGIDSVVRRKWRGQIRMANIGYGNAKATRNVHPDGLKHFNVHNEKDLELLLMRHTTHAAVIGAKVGKRNRIAIINRAKELDIKIVNEKAKVRTEEN
ncbi:60S ribosomal protein L32-A [Diplonema papillatum]|nr:60S ribosomal protein L32-A [Diplonema papillatum]KAJ9466934.1 60S ribosomal protein L32-A [Diplonema papillatum]